MFGAVIVLDFPRRQDQRDFAVGEVKIRIFQRFFLFFKFEDVHIKARQRTRINGAYRQVLDMAILLPIGLSPNAADVIETGLAQVEQMAFRIV